MPNRNLRRLGALALGVVLPALLLEGGIRAFLPAHTFLDRRRECFWVLRLRDALRTSAVGKSRLEEDPVLGWRPRSGTQREGETTNSLGLRGPREFSLAKPSGIRRIAVLGDSFTYGLDVLDEQTYCMQLERSEPGLEVLNFGVSGIGTDQQYLRWKRDAAPFAPDLVLLGFYLPDVDRNVLTVRELPKPRFVLEGGELREIPVPSGPVRPYVEQLASGCRSTSRALDFLGYLLRRTEDPEPAAELHAKAELAQAILARFHSEVRAQGSSFVVVLIPHPELFHDPGQLELARAIAACGAREGFPVLDLTPLLDAEQRAHPERVLYGDSEHWNAEGHALAAGWIHDFLRGLGLL